MVLAMECSYLAMLPRLLKEHDAGGHRAEAVRVVAADELEEGAVDEEQRDPELLSG